MIWVTDRTGRFPQRPHYKPQELDSECEAVVCKFLQDQHSKIEFPVLTDDLTTLIEQDVSDLDLYADLSTEGEDVEGATDFFPNRKPVVLISKGLSLQSRRENRLRTTLAHEYGHVRFHAFLWTSERSSQLRLSADFAPAKGPRCRRATILSTSKTDWMEWQAGYASGALLMPITALQKLIRSSLREWGMYGRLSTNSSQAQEIVKRMAALFSVSSEAAKVRLSQLGYLENSTQDVSLFDKSRP